MDTKEHKRNDKPRSSCKDRYRQDDEYTKAKERGRNDSKERGLDRSSSHGSGRRKLERGLDRSSSHRSGRGLDRSSSHRNGPRNQEERDATTKARGGRSSSSKPGVSHEFNSSDLAHKKSSRRTRSVESPHSHASRRKKSPKKRDDKNGYRNRGPSTPGVQAERCDRDRARRKQARNIGPGVQAERSDRDRARHKESRNTSNARGVILDDAIAPNVTAPNTDEGCAVQASIVRDGVVYQGRTREEEETRMSLVGEDEAKRRRQRKNRRSLAILVLVFVLIGGGVGAYFGFRGSPGINSLAGDDASVDNRNSQNSADATKSESPSTYPTNSASIPPSKFAFKYPPPDLEACQRLRNREPRLAEEGTLEDREFKVQFDLGLSSADINITSVLTEVGQKIAEWLLQPLVGCDLQRRLGDEKHDSSGITDDALRRLQASQDPLRYMIADVMDIRAIDEGACSADPPGIPNCRFVLVRMNVVLRGDELNLYVLALIAKFFPEGKNLKAEIGLSDDIVIFTVHSIRATGPTKAPSVMPSWEPSVSLSFLPTIPIPESSNPSALVPEPTNLPSASPSKTPSKTPSSAPFTPPPTPGPTPNPTSASVAPVIAATPSPSNTPSISTSTPSRTPSKDPSMVPSAAPISACASLDLNYFDEEIMFANDQNGDEHYYSFGYMGLWNVWDGAQSATLQEISRAAISATYSDSISGKSGLLTLLTTPNAESYLEVIANGSTYEMNIYLAEPTCEIPSSGNSCGATLQSIAIDNEVFGEDAIGDEHYYSFSGGGINSYYIWDGRTQIYMSAYSSSASKLRAFYEDSMSEKSAEVFLLTTPNAESYFEVIRDDSTYVLNIYLSESSCDLPSSGNSCGATLQSFDLDSKVFGDDANGDEHYYSFSGDDSFSIWDGRTQTSMSQNNFGMNFYSMWDGRTQTIMSEYGKSPSALRAYYEDFMTGKNAEVFLLTTPNAESYIEVIANGSTYELKIYLSESSCELPKSGNSCGATLQSFAIDSKVFGEDAIGDEHYYFFSGGDLNTYTIWDGKTQFYLSESEYGISPSKLRAYYEDSMTEKSAEVFLLTTPDAESYLEVVRDGSTYVLNIYLSESSCELPSSGNSCGATLDNFEFDSKVFGEGEDANGDEHYYSFLGDGMNTYTVWDGRTQTSMSEYSISSSKLRAYYEDSMTEKSAKVSLLTTPNAESFLEVSRDGSTYVMQIYLSESSCQLPSSGNSCGATLQTVEFGTSYAVDASSRNHTYTFLGAVNSYYIGTDIYLSEYGKSPSALRAYYEDSMTGNSAEVFLFAGTGDGLFQIIEVDATVFRVNIYLSSSCEAP